MNPYERAKEICQTLFDKGYTAYFAGGWVRDLILGRATDEIDIATSAPPYVIQELFPKTVEVGIAFGVVIVVMDDIHFEVTTFRKDHTYLDGRHPQSVDFSTPEKDAQRRDFTINGMFFDPLTETLYDFVGGREDLQKGIIRAIGNAKERFEEDRLRMLRAVRFAARFGFPIEAETAKAISQFAPNLFPSVSIERVWQELCKMSVYPHFGQAIKMLYQYGLLSVIFPQLSNLSLRELEKRIQFFPYFPLETPTIVYLLELFTNQTLEEKLSLCDYLKTPHREKKITAFFHEGHALFARTQISAWEWAHFYAHPSSDLFLKVAAAKILPPQKTHFLDEHTERQLQLVTHIQRIRSKKPLITAAHLKQIGIQPGKKMGILLNKAEQMSINENIEDADMILHRLVHEISDL